HARRSCRSDLSLAAFQREFAERPLETVASRCTPGETQALRLEEVAQLREVDVRVRRVPHRLSGARLPERAHRIVELRASAVQSGRDVGDLELARYPQQRASDVGE